MTAAESVAVNTEGGSEGPTGTRFVLHALVAGIICGFLAVVMSISFASVLLPRSLSAYLPVAAGLALFTSAVASFVSGLTSDIRGSVSVIQEVPLIAMASLAAPIATAVAAYGGPEALAATTIFVALAITTALTGIALLALGYFRLGGLVRFVPYPVMGGFLAGTGWLILEAGLGLVAGRHLTLKSLVEVIHDPTVLGKASVALAFVGLASLARSVTRGAIVLPVIAVAGIVAYNIVVFAFGLSQERLLASGWLIAVPQGTSLWPPFMPSDLATVDWSAIFAQILGVPGVMIVTVSALLMNASGIELETAEDVNLDRELRSVGLQNVLAALGGGGPAYPAVSLSLLSIRLGAKSRLTSVVVAIVVAASLVAGETIFSIVPTPLLGGLLIWLGGSMMAQWLVVAARRLVLPEYLIILLIFGFIAFVGFTTGIAVGLLAAVGLFLFEYGRIDSIRHALTGRDYQSTVQISEERRHALQEYGDAILIIRLQGFIFFGTADRFRRAIESRVRQDQGPAVRFLVVDLHRVTGVDSSTALSFTRLARLAERLQLTVVVTGLSSKIHATLRRGGVEFDGAGPLHLMETLDEGLGWCESRLLENVAPGVASPKARDVGEMLAGMLNESDAVAWLLPYLERIEVPEGEILLHQGEPSDDVFFLESGRAAVETESGHGNRVRLAMFGPGAVVGEIAFYTGRPRSASVVAASHLVAWRLTRDSIRRLQEEVPAAAFRLHEGLAAILADRLASTDRLVRFLAD